MKRTRATMIVERPEGVLLTAIRGQGWLLPGGGVDPGETEEQAAIRELLEETGLRAEQAEFLFAIETRLYRHAVFRANTTGNPTPSSEVDQLAFYAPGDRLRLAPITDTILRRYFSRP